MLIFPVTSKQFFRAFSMAFFIAVSRLLLLME
jgi:hypothetical protein